MFHFTRLLREVSEIMGVMLSIQLGMWQTVNGSLWLVPFLFPPTHCPRPEALPQNSQVGRGSCRPPLALSFFFVASQPSKKLCQKEKWKSVGERNPSNHNTCIPSTGCRWDPDKGQVRG